MFLANSVDPSTSSTNSGVKSSLVQKATKLLILSHLVSHGPTRIRFDVSGLTYRKDELDQILVFLKDEMSTMLRGLMFSTLTKLLRELEYLCREANPANWPSIYLSLCVLLSAAESMAVDRYVYGPPQVAERSVRDMEESVLLYLLGHLERSTSGRSPLDLDWTMSKNMALLQNDPGGLYVIRRLQTFRETNMTFVAQQAAAEYGSGHSRDMVGKMVARILI